MERRSHVLPQPNDDALDRDKHVPIENANGIFRLDRRRGNQRQSLRRLEQFFTQLHRLKLRRRGRVFLESRPVWRLHRQNKNHRLSGFEIQRLTRFAFVGGEKRGEQPRPEILRRE